MAGTQSRPLDDRETLEWAFATYGRDLFAYCLRRSSTRATAEDVFQKVFLEAWRRREEVDLDSGPQWLYGTAKNVLMSDRRSQERCERARTNLEYVQRRHGEEPGDELARVQAIRTIAASLKSLPDSQRQVVVLCLLDDCSYEDAADRLHVPIGTVRSRLSRARLSLLLSARTAGVL